MIDAPPSQFPDPSQPEPSRAEVITALFASMVVQNAQMALMSLGKMPHPETGQRFHDPESARMFYDQLDMLDVKTSGNRNAKEEALLSQSLAAVRKAYTEVVGPLPEPEPIPPSQSAPALTAVPAPSPTPAAAALEEAPAPAAPPTPEPQPESRKRYTKTY